MTAGSPNLTVRIASTSVKRVATRMTAQDRRAQLVAVASGLFATSGYRDTTTAQIAAAAGVSEPVIYRHFTTKRELYLACVTEAWDDVRTQLRAAVDAEPDPARRMLTLSTVGLGAMQRHGRAQLWLQLHGESMSDPEIRQFARDNLAQVHGFVSGLIASAQSAGGVAADRNPQAEAWIFISVGLLAATATRIRDPELIDITSIVASRQEWLRPG